MAASPPAGTPDLTPRPGPVVRDSSQLVQLIALGQTIAVMPATATAHLRRDLVAVPVLDAAPISLVLAWPECSCSTTLAAFVRAAAEVAARDSTSPPAVHAGATSRSRLG